MPNESVGTNKTIEEIETFKSFALILDDILPFRENIMDEFIKKIDVSWNDLVIFLEKKDINVLVKK